MAYPTPGWAQATADFLWDGRTFYDALEARFEADALKEDPTYSPTFLIETVVLLDNGDYMIVHRPGVKQ